VFTTPLLLFETDLEACLGKTLAHFRLSVVMPLSLRSCQGRPPQQGLDKRVFSRIPRSSSLLLQGMLRWRT
jgi:hypothetical protein